MFTYCLMMKFTNRYLDVSSIKKGYCDIANQMSHNAASVMSVSIVNSLTPFLFVSGLSAALVFIEGLSSSLSCCFTSVIAVVCYNIAMSIRIQEIVEKFMIGGHMMMLLPVSSSLMPLEPSAFFPLVSGLPADTEFDFISTGGSSFDASSEAKMAEGSEITTPAAL